jgi:hypothetical protein
MARAKGIDWSAQPLGQVPDTEIARAAGCTQVAVLQARQRAGLPPCITTRHLRPKGIMWEFEPLGQHTDAEIAESLGCTAMAVCCARKARGIPPHRKHRQKTDNDVKGAE